MTRYPHEHMVTIQVEDACCHLLKHIPHQLPKWRRVFQHIFLPALFPTSLVFDYSSISQREEVLKQMSGILP